MSVLCRGKIRYLWKKLSLCLVLGMCAGLLWRCGRHCDTYNDCLDGEVCAKNQQCVPDSPTACVQFDSPPLRFWSGKSIDRDESVCGSETEFREYVRHPSGCWTYAIRRCGGGQKCYYIKTGRVECRCDEATAAECSPERLGCQNETVLHACERDAVTGCLIKSVQNCEGKTGCYQKGPTLGCFPSCSANADCSGGTVCQFIEDNTAARCENNKDRPTLDSLCYVEFKTVKVMNCSSDWDIFSGPDTKLVVKIPDAENFLIPSSTDKCELTWNQKTPEYRYAQIARMVMTVYDSDGEFPGNQDDLIETWSPTGGHWLVSNAKSQSFALTTKNAALTFAIHCR